MLNTRSPHFTLAGVEIDILRHTDIFFDLTANQLDMLASICDEQAVKLGDIILRKTPPVMKCM
jgi:hypothetical protein